MKSIVRLLACVLIAAAGVSVNAQPNPLLTQRVRALLAALKSGPEALEAFAKEHYTAAYLESQTPAQRQELLERVTRELGGVTDAGLDREAPAVVAVVLEGRNGKQGRLLYEHEPQTFKVVRLELGAVGESPDAAPPAPVTGQMSASELNAALDRYLTALAQEGKLSGVLLVARDGKPVFEKGYNLANRADDIPNTPATRFSIGSINKSFTRVALGQLAAAGKLKLTDTIGTHLPDHPNADAKRITIDQLVRHQGGLADFFSPEMAGLSRSRFRTNRDMYDHAARLPLEFEPGSREQYCNSCYVVLGEIIARAAGTTYESYVEQNVLQRAGMKTAGFFQSDEIRPNVATHYTATPNGLRSIVHIHPAGGNAAGSAYATAADLLALDNALRDGKLLDPQWTAWFFRMPQPVSGRVMAGHSAAGGARGMNAAMLGNGTLLVAGLSNFDERFMENVAAAVMRALTAKKETS